MNLVHTTKPTHSRGSGSEIAHLDVDMVPALQEMVNHCYVWKGRGLPIIGRQGANRAPPGADSGAASRTWVATPRTLLNQDLNVTPPWGANWRQSASSRPTTPRRPLGTAHGCTRSINSNFPCSCFTPLCKTCRHHSDVTVHTARRPDIATPVMA